LALRLGLAAVGMLGGFFGCDTQAVRLGVYILEVS
jgi:hypothetical protein